MAPDKARDIRGAAIKLLDVPGQKLLEGEEDSPTHDFILISAQAFVTKDVKEFDGLIKALVRGKLALSWFLLRHLRVARNLIASLKRHASVLQIQYFSVTPYKFGGRRRQIHPEADLRIERDRVRSTHGRLPAGGLGRAAQYGRRALRAHGPTPGRRGRTADRRPGRPLGRVAITVSQDCHSPHSTSDL